jgi:hypothetical protein
VGASHGRMARLLAAATDPPRDSAVSGSRRFGPKRQ